LSPITIPVYKPFFHGREKEYVNRCLDGLWIAKGEFVTRFEAQFAERLGAGCHAATVCNGTAALHLAFLALGIGPGDEVLVPSLTYIASVNMIALTGATPVLVDSTLSTWQMDPEDVRRKVTSRTRAILAVHLYGQACEMGELLKICHEKGLWLVEDCAEAFGTFYKGRSVGTFGEIATYSFFGNKTITTGEGGMVVSRNADLLDKAVHLRGQGVSPVVEYWHDVLGFNYRMNNISAAIGLAQFEQADEILERKRRVAVWYREMLGDMPLELHGEAEGTHHSFWMCSALAANERTRDALRAHLRGQGIETRPVFHPAHTMPVFHSSLPFPVAESLCRRGFNLPSYPGLTEDVVAQVCTSIREFYGGNQEIYQSDGASRSDGSAA
jgi:perosamine synthetase